LQTITLDNASSNDVAIRELADHIFQNFYSNMSEEFFHNCCFAHILNLIVKDDTLKTSANSYPTLNNAFASILNIHTHLLSIRSHTEDFIRNEKLELDNLNDKLQNIRI
ncbi:10311_t:CDS:2, partial [Scutellospora calospora]